MHLALSTHARDFHPLDCTHAGHTKLKIFRSTAEKNPPSLSSVSVLSKTHSTFRKGVLFFRVQKTIPLIYLVRQPLYILPFLRHLNLIAKPLLNFSHNLSIAVYCLYCPCCLSNSHLLFCLICAFN